MQHEALALHFEHDELHTGPNERLAAFEVEDEPLRRRFQRKSGKNWKVDDDEVGGDDDE